MGDGQGEVRRQADGRAVSRVCNVTLTCDATGVTATFPAGDVGAPQRAGWISFAGFDMAPGAWQGTTGPANVAALLMKVRAAVLAQNAGAGV